MLLLVIEQVREKKSSEEDSDDGISSLLFVMLENYHHSLCFRKVFRHESKDALTLYIKSNLLTFDLYPNFKKDRTIIVADAVTYII